MIQSCPRNLLVASLGLSHSVPTASFPPPPPPPQLKGYQDTSQICSAWFQYPVSCSPKSPLLSEYKPQFWVRRSEPSDMRLEPQGKVPVPEKLTPHQQLPLKCREEMDFSSIVSSVPAMFSRTTPLATHNQK